MSENKTGIAAPFSEDALLSLVNDLVKPAAAATPTAPPSPAAPEKEALGDDELARLRQLILGREIAELRRLQGDLADTRQRAEAVSQVLTEAIVQRTRRDRSLEGVLKPTVERIFRSSVRQNPAELADSLFPVIGPAIRRSIAESIKGMFQDFSRTLEMSFSPKGLKWRLEAWRTGRSFSEVVLLNTLEYQVEQLFLVKSGTGELLDHLVADGAAAHDGEQVAAMFTAVQHFVNDSFERGGLSTLEFGEVEVFVAHSTLAYIACVVRGQVPLSLRQDLQEALEQVVMEYGDEIENFSGDSTVFIPSRRHVEQLLSAKFKAEAQPLWARVLPYALLALVLGGAAFLLYKDTAMKNLAERVYTETAAPGLVPLRVEPRLFGPWRISYLRDNSAINPRAALKALGIGPDDAEIILMPYISQESALVEKLTRQLLYDPAAEALAAKRAEAEAEIQLLVERINSVKIFFPSDSDSPVAEDLPKLTKAVDDLVTLEKLAAELKMTISLTIYGHTDATGSARHNYELSQERTKTLAAMLYAKGSRIPISNYGLGADFAGPGEKEKTENPNSRKIELRVTVQNQ